MPSSPIKDADPETVWKALAERRGALLVDVRTRAEWSFVGLPDLAGTGREPALIEWQSFPSMAMNPAFVDEALSVVAEADAEEVYFLCRSGVRSLHAAHAVSAAADAAGRQVACVNVAGGFEGDHDETGKRGLLNGWKAAGLPWRQG